MTRHKHHRVRGDGRHDILAGLASGGASCSVLTRGIQPRRIPGQHIAATAIRSGSSAVFARARPRRGRRATVRLRGRVRRLNFATFHRRAPGVGYRDDRCSSSPRSGLVALSLRPLHDALHCPRRRKVAREGEISDSVKLVSSNVARLAAARSAEHPGADRRSHRAPGGPDRGYPVTALAAAYAYCTFRGQPVAA